MLYSVLAVGDVVGEAGLAHLERHLRPLQKLKNISFTVVNGGKHLRRGSDLQAGVAGL